jgi:hypothetical protein
LKSDVWIKRLKPEERLKVLNAFNVDSTAQLVTSLNEKKENENLFNNLTDGALSIPEYLRMRRDRNIIRSLIFSEGIEYSFGVKSKEQEILPPEYLNENITWHIDIYQFGENHYRFTAKVVVEPFDVRLTNDVVDTSDPNQRKIFYDTRFKLKKSPPGIKPIPGVSSSTPVPPPKLNKPVDGISAELNGISTELKKSLLPLSGFLSIIGGVEKIGDTVSGLLGGTDNTSIVGGGLVSFDEGGVSPFIGVNQEIGKIGDNITSGVLFGVGTGDKTSLFVGPSLQYSVFTISAGARLGTQVNSDVNFAGMIAVDLSRLTNSKKESLPTPIALSNSGGGLNSKKEDEEFAMYAAIEYTAEKTTTLTRVCDEKDTKIPQGSMRYEVPISPTIANKVRRDYLYKGVYEYLNSNNDKSYLILLDSKLHIHNFIESEKVDLPPCLQPKTSP